MNRKLFATAIAIAALVVLSSVTLPLIQKGLASRASTDSDEDLSSQYVVVKPTAGGLLKIPSIEYEWDDTEGCSKPSVATKSVSGTISLGVISDTDKYLSLLVSFKEIRSWMLIKKMTLTINDSPFVIYDSNNRGAGDWVSLGEWTTSNYDFTLIVEYKEKIHLLPGAIHGTGMESTILFMLGKDVPNDPLAV